MATANLIAALDDERHPLRSAIVALRLMLLGLVAQTGKDKTEGGPPWPHHS